MNAPRWDLEALFPGGLGGEAFANEATGLEARAEELVTRAEALGAPTDPEPWVQWMLEAQELSTRTHTLSTFVHCLASADTFDEAAERAAARVGALWNRISRAWVPVQDGIAFGDGEAIGALIARPELEEMRPMLERSREQAGLLLPRGEQALATELARDGIQAWGRVYDRLSGRLQIELGGETLSATQVMNLFGSTDAALRTRAHEAWGQAWEGVYDDCARALTHITGTRQVLNDRRGVGELADTQAANRLERASLDAMLEASRRAGPMLERYLGVKARLLGVDQMGWEDLAAPLPSKSSAQSWEEAEAFILDNFGAYHPELRAFAEGAFGGGWVEAEDRGGKRPGAWCAFAPTVGQSRVFLTFGGTFRSTVTLAHELGHAFHNHAIRDLPAFRRQVPSTLAETASIFAESLVRDAALRAADDVASKRSMLDARLMAGVSFLMNIPVRYEFERRLYALRREGPLQPDVLAGEMESLQRDWYRGALRSWDPSFWASKLHFYISGRSFYNYPYTYGYLFAQLVYRRVLEGGQEAHADYVELLRRTGWQQGEVLAQETLGLDLRDPEVWWQAIAPLEADLEALEGLV